LLGCENALTTTADNKISGVFMLENECTLCPETSVTSKTSLRSKRANEPFKQCIINLVYIFMFLLDAHTSKQQIAD